MHRFNSLWKNIATAFLMISLGWASSATANDLTIGNASGAPGSAVEVLLQLNDGADVAGIQARIAYDSRLTFVGITKSDLTSDLMVDWHDANSVVSLLLWTDPVEEVGVASGDVAILTFIIPSDATNGESFTLAFTGIDGGGDPLAAIPAASTSNAGESAPYPESLITNTFNGEVATIACTQYNCLIDQLFLDLFWREVTSVVREIGSNLLCEGSITMPGLAHAILEIDEFENYLGFINRAYFGLFNNNYTTNYETPDYRVPDLAGVTNWLEDMLTLGDVSEAQLDVVQGFTQSPEWQLRVGNLTNEEYVEFLYQNILGRPSDPSGKQGYLDNLNNGTVTSDSLALTFLLSDEAVNKYQNQTAVAMGYLGLQNREIQRAEFIGLMRRLDQGVIDAEDVMWIFLIGMPEFETRLLANGCPLPHSAVAAVSFDESASHATEDSGWANIAVSLSHLPLSTVTVDYTVTGGNASGGGIDYTLSAGTLTFNVGQPIQQHIPIQLTNDGIGEPPEAVYITLSNPSLNSLVWPLHNHAFTIYNDDAIEKIKTRTRHTLWQLYTHIDR